jgi:hypothetical protein
MLSYDVMLDARLFATVILVAKARLQRVEWAE